MHKKWDDIELQVDLRNHSAALSKISGDKKKTASPEKGKRAAERVFGSGGALEKIMRQEYERGVSLLTTNKFESKAEKEQWVEWRDNLTAEELAMVTCSDWQ